MDVAPPPLDEEVNNASAVNGKEDGDLFAGVVDDVTEPTSSGYDSKSGEAEVGRSNTMDDVTRPVHLDSDEDIFRSSRIEPEPEKGSSNAFVDAKEDVALEDEDEEPFRDAHLKPQLQLSGPGTGSAPPSNGGTAFNRMDDVLEEDADAEFIEIKVTSPHKVGEGMSSYMAYSVKTRTNLNYFKNKEMVVNRRFSDFLGLHDKLSEKYLQNGRIIPPAPDKSVVGMTKVKMSKEGGAEGGGGGGQDEFVERRRAALERFLNRTAVHPSLRTDPDFREFLELETDLPKASQTAALSGKSVMRLINKVGDSITNITLKLEETDDWFEEKTNMFEQLELQLKKLHQSTELLVDHRKTLAANTLHLGKSLAVLSGSEDNSGLSAAIAQLSTVQEAISGTHNGQAAVEFFELSELIKDYLGLVGAVKDVLNERTKAWQSWQSATANLTKKREAKAKAELQHKPEKVALYRSEITELEHQQEMAQENFERISRLIKREVEAFEARMVVDFKRTIVRFLESLLAAQDEIAAQWERYIPEIHQVAL